MKYIHDLGEQGKINSDKLKGNAKVVYLWKRYRRVAAIAASIAGIVAIGLSTLVNSLAPRPKDSKITDLVAYIDQVKRDVTTQIDTAIKKTKPFRIDIPVKYNGTGFLLTQGFNDHKTRMW